MKPESYAWSAMNDHAASLLRPGFAERTVRAARDVAPTFASQVILSLVTATVCLTFVLTIDWHLNSRETERNLAGWEKIAAESELLGQL